MKHKSHRAFVRHESVARISKHNQPMVNAKPLALVVEPYNACIVSINGATRWHKHEHGRLTRKSTWSLRNQAGKYICRHIYNVHISDTDVRIDRVYVLDIRHHTYSAYINRWYVSDRWCRYDYMLPIWFGTCVLDVWTDGILWTLPTIHILHVTPICTYRLSVSFRHEAPHIFRIYQSMKCFRHMVPIRLHASDMIWDMHIVCMDRWNTLDMTHYTYLACSSNMYV